jgi:2-(1,2-epoxy-1,2-dihydrophenyl)acetyl-CoA isomerase
MPNVLYDVSDSVATLTLNRPDRYNAVTDEVLHDLRTALEKAAADHSIRAIVLTGAGRGFCSGADVSTIGSQEKFSYSAYLEHHYHPLMMLMLELPKPIIGAINGVAAGAGMSLALGCDIRVAATSASFTQAFIKIGLVPDSGSTWFLPRIVGAGRALELMFTGRKCDSAEALQIGLVSQVFPDEGFAQAAQDYARQLAALPTRTLSFIKQGVHYALEHNFVSALHEEAELQDRAGRTHDHHEGIQAFLEKRQPKFIGG